MTYANSAVRFVGRTVSLWTLAVFALTSACSEDPVPLLPAEPAEVAQSVTSMFNVFTTPVMSHFRNTTFPAIAAQLGGSGPARVPHDGLLPDILLGKTLTWNLGTQDYSVSARPGAPPNGVSFVLYQQTGAGPAVPLVEVGTVTFVDQGTPQALSVGVIIHTATNTVAQYNINGSRSGATVALADGVARDEAATPTELSFDVNVSTNPQAGTNSTVAEFISADGTRLVYSFNLIQGTDQSTLRVEKGATVISYQMGAGAATGTVELDGVVVANVAGNSISPVANSGLSPEDVAALITLRQSVTRLQTATIVILVPFNLLF